VELTWETDAEYELVGLAKVQERSDSWDVTRTDGWSFGFPKVPGVTPKVGSAVRFYGKGIGATVRGVVVDGNPVYYRTPAEEEQRHQDWCAEQDRQKRARFEESKAKLDVSYDALPRTFQLRIDRFRTANPDFRWKYEPYEMFVCEQAVIIAKALKTVDAIEAFHSLPWETQKFNVPELSDGHSGNTFGCACHLAKTLLTEPARIEYTPGAMSPLVGTSDYSEAKEAPTATAD